jgi:hypothetical protein
MSKYATNWIGLSGRSYQYWIYPIGTSFRLGSGNYIFAKQIDPDEWLPLYIGQSGNLIQICGDPEILAVMKKRGATHIHVHYNEASARVLRIEEIDLIRNWRPLFNEKNTKIYEK